MLLGGERMLNAPKKVHRINQHAIMLNSVHLDTQVELGLTKYKGASFWR